MSGRPSSCWFSIQHRIRRVINNSTRCPAALTTVKRLPPGVGYQHAQRIRQQLVQTALTEEPRDDRMDTKQETFCRNHCRRQRCPTASPAGGLCRTRHIVDIETDKVVIGIAPEDGVPRSSKPRKPCCQKNPLHLEPGAGAVDDQRLGPSAHWRKRLRMSIVC